jgi:hypothetical protein
MLSNKQVEELGKHQPILRGGVILAGICLACLLGLLTVLLLVSVAFEIKGDFPRFLFWGHCLVIGILFVTVVVLPWFFLGWTKVNGHSWFREYWRRNVVGCELWCIAERDTVGNLTSVKHELELRRAKRRTDLALALPLGGWFTKARIVGFEERRRRLGGKWSVKLHGVVGRQIVIRLEDYENNSFLLECSEALEVLIEFVLNHEPSYSSWQGILTQLLYVNSVLVKGQRSRIEELEGQLHSFLDSMVARLMSYSEEIKRTNRFGKSKEAQRVRHTILVDLVEITPTNYPLVPYVKKELDDIVRALKEAEEKRAEAKASQTGKGTKK